MAKMFLRSILWQKIHLMVKKLNSYRMGRTLKSLMRTKQNTFSSCITLNKSMSYRYRLDWLGKKSIEAKLNAFFDGLFTVDFFIIWWSEDFYRSYQKMCSKLWLLRNWKWPSTDFHLLIWTIGSTLPSTKVLTIKITKLWNGSGRPWGNWTSNNCQSSSTSVQDPQELQLKDSGKKVRY